MEDGALRKVKAAIHQIQHHIYSSGLLIQVIQSGMDQDHPIHRHRVRRTTNWKDDQQWVVLVVVLPHHGFLQTIDAPDVNSMQ